MLIDKLPALINSVLALMGSFSLFLISLLCFSGPIGCNSVLFPEFPSLELDGAMRSFVSVHRASGSSSGLLAAISA